MYPKHCFIHQIGGFPNLPHLEILASLAMARCRLPASANTCDGRVQDVAASGRHSSCSKSMKIAVLCLAANLCTPVIRRKHRRSERLQTLASMGEQDVGAVVWLVLEVEG